MIKFTRPWYAVPLRMLVLPVVLLLILIEYAGECAHDWVSALDKYLP